MSPPAKVERPDKAVEKFTGPVFQMQAVPDGEADKDRQHDGGHSGRLNDGVDADRNGAEAEKSRQIVF